MKQHVIIPIFIPHEGCKNDCVFCNQKMITAKNQAPSLDQMEEIITTWMATIKSKNIKTREIAFYGGSFTGLEINMQLKYLKAAKKWKDKGEIHKIHISTRPDYIDETILTNLKAYGVDIIELGVQSFDELVLARSKRGHGAEVVYTACDLIKKYDFTLGIQLMVGLPGDSHEKCLYSAKEAIKLKPTIARLYPTIVLPNTELFDLFQKGAYQGISQEEALYTTKEMFKLLTEAGINVIRVGLKSSDFINEQSCNAGETYHPAFRQIVESRLAIESVEEQIQSLIQGRFSQRETPDKNQDHVQEIILTSNGRCFSNLIGHKGTNKRYLSREYPQFTFKFQQDNHLPNYCYKVSI